MRTGCGNITFGNCTDTKVTDTGICPHETFVKMFVSELRSGA